MSPLPQAGSGAAIRGCVPGGNICRQGGRGRHARQQEAQAKLSDWFGCALHPDLLSSPGRERCKASRRLANNNLPVAARSFGAACAEFETRLLRTKRRKIRFSLFPRALISLYAGCARNLHAKRAAPSGSGFRCVRNVDRSISYGGTSARSVSEKKQRKRPNFGAANKSNIRFAAPS